MASKPKPRAVAAASLPDLRAAYTAACDAAAALYDPSARSDAWLEACGRATLAWNRLQQK